MDPTGGHDEARVLAQRLAAAGLASQDQLRAAYQAFGQESRGSGFGAFLVARGLIDQHALDAVNASPSASRREFRHPLADMPIGEEAPRTIAYQEVIQPPAPPAPRNQTAAYDAVLPPSASGQSGRLSQALTQPDPQPPDRRVRSTSDEQTEPLDVMPDQEEAFFRSMEQPALVTPEPRVGESLGDYQLTSVLGRGGMGVVFAATREDSERSYALKVLLAGPEGGQQARRVRFRREVETLRGLDHPNLVRVYDCGRVGSHLWYSMDLVQGQDLAVALESGPPLERRRLLEIFEQICAGVGHAHERGIVHRDLKPSNVVLGPDGTVHVLDFGLAKAADGMRDKLTRSGATLGTPYYMSPEQISNARDVDVRSDVFALGVMLYEMVTGRLPFPGYTAGEVANKIINEDPERPRKLKPRLPPNVEAICLKALEKDRERRYQDASEMHRDLVRHRRGKRLHREGFANDVRRWLERNLEGFLVGVVVATLLWAPLMALLALILS